jgi:uncharacterized membrane protein YjfL (UPF0719 family)
MSQLLQHLSMPSTAAALLYAVITLLRPALQAAIQHDNTTRTRVEILLAGAACVAVFLVAAWIAWRIIAPLAH